MAATKASATIQASTTNGAGATTNGTELDLSTAYGALVCAKITNGGTGPTIGCDFVVYVGEGTGTKREFSRQTAGLTNSGVYEFVVEIPPAAMFINVTFTGNTGQTVTVECYAQKLTGI
jgi:hypothetical protein